MVQRSLQALLPELTDERWSALEVTGITQDSRNVSPGDLFCARAGGRFKGSDFIPAAIAAGAAAVLVDSTEMPLPESGAVPVLAVDNLALRLGEIAARFYGYPSQSMAMVGITGTNGKTSCSHFVAQALNRSGKKTAVIGTIGNGFPDQLSSATHTTPDAITLQRMLAEFRDQGAVAVVMEVSSHAIEQQRIGGIGFDVVAFTNLSRDHLDYHGTMEAYGEAKAKLFTEYGAHHAVICADDPFGQQLIARLQGGACELTSFGLQTGDVSADAVVLDTSGISATLNTPWGVLPITTRVVGRFNLWNLMLTASVLGVMGFDGTALGAQLEALEPVPGRMQCLGGYGAPLVVVDYAHTPDALEKALIATREHTRGELICVFGCGGDRDQGKRAQMGRVASEHSDRIVVTSDNPRSEAPDAIIDMIFAGIAAEKSCTREPDRTQAIKAALALAGADDAVLIAGKGHENYQEIQGRRLPFDDVDVARHCLQEWAK